MPNVTDYSFVNGRYDNNFFTTVTRSMTSNQQTGLVLPAGLLVTQVSVFSQVASNAGGTATISVGSTNSTSGVFVSALNVATVTGQAVPSASAIVGTILPSQTFVTASYNETGSASTAGGPWTVQIQGILI